MTEPAGTPSRAALTEADFDFALVLSGGNALGAYQAGAYQALHEADWLPHCIAGASAGAINGAVICGNAPDDRLAQLRALWTPSPAFRPGRGGSAEDARRSAAALLTLAAGRPGLFAPRSLGWPWDPLGLFDRNSLYDTSPMRQELARLIDFDRLNEGATRFLAAAVDVATGEDVIFDMHRHRIGPDHLRASAALLPAFPPVDIEGRLLADAGISANLPLDFVLSEPRERPLLCLAIDLLPLKGGPPTTIGASVSRMQDLIFATQSRRAIAAWQAIHDERKARGQGAPVTLVHVAYSDQAREVSGKAFDFSPASAADRWQAGLEDIGLILDGFASGHLRVRQEPGMSVYARPGPDTGFEKTRFELAPKMA
ncbi:MAG: patatin [Novosphingobium lindaniclasticum]|jgi:NTE family protein|uniref:patatin-like phospholipase family protein n=1 Tax=Novosphingobium lindaniclasticum TaxID=1329895 RepID=UPI00240976B6|nr:patatin-like phospholipase family protein [Novosphingobium lindaniclasticum]MDF2638727.1 patatin [Novosphingobium lindaniclasticum]